MDYCSFSEWMRVIMMKNVIHLLTSWSSSCVCVCVCACVVCVYVCMYSYSYSCSMHTISKSMYKVNYCDLELKLSPYMEQMVQTWIHHTAPYRIIPHRTNASCTCSNINDRYFVWLCKIEYCYLNSWNDVFSFWLSAVCSMVIGCNFT